MQQAGVGRDALGTAGNQEQPGQVLSDDRFEARAHDLDHHFFTTLEFGGMNLSYRGRGQWLDVEAAEYVADFRPELFFDQGDGLLWIEGRHPVLQQHQLIRDVFGQQVATGRQQLAELDEDRPQVLQGQAQTCAATELQGLAWEPAPRHQMPQGHQPPG
ncbi:hypothetical protein D3C78_1366880 [compost metagenome]